MIELPLKPSNDVEFPSALKKKDRDTIVYAVIHRVANEKAFALYNPEYLTEDGKTLNKSGKVACRQMFGWGAAKDYRTAYEKTLAEFLGCRQTSGKVSEGDTISDKRKDEALKSLFDKAMTLVEGQGDLDADTLKIAAEIFKKIGLLKDEVEQQIRPVRVLPTRCGECRYKAFVESSVLNSDAIDCCAYCRARKLAEEHGYRFNDGKDLLDIPEEVIKELESKNDVKLTDILSGKVEN